MGLIEQLQVGILVEVISVIASVEKDGGRGGRHGQILMSLRGRRGATAGDQSAEQIGACHGFGFLVSRVETLFARLNIKRLVEAVLHLRSRDNDLTQWAAGLHTLLELFVFHGNCNPKFLDVPNMFL